MHFPTCQVVKNKREQGKSGAERKPRGVREEEGNGVVERVTEVIVKNIFHPYFRKKKKHLTFSFNCKYMI